MPVRSGLESGLVPDAGIPKPGAARHAALLLHAMVPADRAWVLDALPMAQCAELQTLLAELEHLGIARDPVPIADATRPGERGATAARPEAPPSDEQRLHALDIGQVRALIHFMRAEPAGLIARLLSLAPWPWRDGLLNGLEAAQRRRVEALLSVSSPGFSTAAAPAAMRTALLAVVDLQVHEGMGDKSERSASNYSHLFAWARLGSRLQRKAGAR